MKNITLRRASVRLRAVAQLAPRMLKAAKLRRRLPAATPAEVLNLPSSSSSAIVEQVLVATTSTFPPIIVGGPPVSHYQRSRKPKLRALAKDALLFSLKALAQSADAFPPLKSAVGGLLFVANQIELVSSNKAQIGEIYAQIDAFAAALVRAVPDATALSPALEAAIRALADDVEAVCVDIQPITHQRWAVRFLRAKRHDRQLQDLARRLEQAKNTFLITISTSTEMKTTQILAGVQPLRGELHRLFRLQARLFFLFGRRI
ncbi:hypothetical protein PENSPDRAFT_456648 [Peniophora sp. CONT]|nr:hypothetical protein PENSPDRAFT_456648 [Peniophora sp. CONT]